jgi:hypothetical protein
VSHEIIILTPLAHISTYAEYTSSSRVVVKIQIRNKCVVVVNAVTGSEREFSRGYDDHIEKRESLGTVPV